MSLTGWCASHGTRQHQLCRFPDWCSCPCHESSTRAGETGKIADRMGEPTEGLSSAGSRPLSLEEK